MDTIEPRTRLRAENTKERDIRASMPDRLRVISSRVLALCMYMYVLVRVDILFDILHCRYQRCGLRRG